MFRLRAANACLRRLLHGSTVNLNQDQVMEKLEMCSAEDQLFDMVGKNKGKFTVNHLNCAVGMLWQFQKTRPIMHRTMALIKNHPEFLALQVLAENKIDLMDDFMLVDMLYSFIRLAVEPHNSVIQQLVSEAWLRLERLPMEPLSKFAVCLGYQHFELSPLMGRITNIVDQKLSSINDARVLGSLMISVSSLASPRLCDALISKADCLLDTTYPSNYSTARNVVHFLRNIMYPHLPLLEKCNKIFLHSICLMDTENISFILTLFRSLHFTGSDFRIAVKQRLIELIDSNNDLFSFTRLFNSLAPLASPETRQWLENTALLADELDAHQALYIAETLEKIRSRNLNLLHKISSVIQRNLHVYKPAEVVKCTQVFFALEYNNPEFFAKLKSTLLNFLRRSVIPAEVTMLTSILPMFPWRPPDEYIISRIDAVLPQCTLKKLSSTAFTVTKWLDRDSFYHRSTSGKYVRLLQSLNSCGRDRLQAAVSLDLLLKELNFISGEWFEEVLLKETVETLQRLKDQLNYRNVSDLAPFLTSKNVLCPPLMDHMASVVIKDIEKIHHFVITLILLPFAVLNYNSVSASDLYEACIQRVIPHISSFDPHKLVFLASTLSMAHCFPQEIISEIFNIDFLGKLDAETDLSDHRKMQTQVRLMALNRAVCLECPEFQVPWFHKDCSQQLQNKGKVTFGPMRQQICKMLSEVLGGINYVRLRGVAPYCYTIDFECILDKHRQPLPYSNPNPLQITDRELVHWNPNSVENIRDELPPGAQRVAVDFLDSKNYCKNSQHMKGESVLKKQHLEILGYHVVQIPHFEWNSMELSTQDAWKEYLKKKIFGESSS
ncbi:FAST kinase domain-containing protein 1, mitochondrial isoform X2 [Thalassophryne amazonica]|uniref:FAST kinase domain-containing protein 1, mitochondrial isoform X2 n=1 Tax=Thalassophryne amazonica TaxID=390379 RepID=UPI001470C4E2|nr:FAST kinase domain-containing protein 1, mitochondrial isoform X2 [Thalassophryne amazonica]